MKLLDYLPLVFKGIKEFKEICKSEDIELEKIKKIIENEIDNQFIITSDLQGIKRFEKMLNIIPLDNESLEERRFKVLTRWNNEIPYTFKVLVNKLNAICGVDGYKIKIKDLTVTVLIELVNKNQFEEVKRLLIQLCPANLIINLDLKYNTYKTYNLYNYSALTQYSYQTLREVVL